MNSLQLNFVVLFSVLSSFLLGQVNPNLGFSIGPTISYSSGTVDLSPNNRAFRGANLSKHNSLSGGIVLKYDFSKFFLQTELTLENRNVNDPVFEPADISPFMANLIASFSYINVPLIVGYKFSSKSLSPYALVGVQLGISTKNEIELIYEADIPSFLNQDQPFTTFDTTEIGILGELGLRYQMSTKAHLTVGLRYTGAERSYFIGSTQLTSGSANLGNKKVGIGVGFLFKV